MSLLRSTSISIAIRPCLHDPFSLVYNIKPRSAQSSLIRAGAQREPWFSTPHPASQQAQTPPGTSRTIKTPCLHSVTATLVQLAARQGEWRLLKFPSHFSMFPGPCPLVNRRSPMQSIGFLNTHIQIPFARFQPALAQLAQLALSLAAGQGGGTRGTGGISQIPILNVHRPFPTCSIAIVDHRCR